MSVSQSSGHNKKLLFKMKKRWVLMFLLRSAGAFVCVKRRASVKVVVSSQQQSADISKAMGDLVMVLSDAVTNATNSWRNQGWQVRKRAGRWLPEVVPAYASLMSGESTAPLRSATATSSLASVSAWLAADDGSRALTTAGLGENERQLAIASEFTKYLDRSEIAFERRESDGALIFRDEAALALSVAAFSLEVTKELGAAARALARYVDDLEVELAAADEESVRLRSSLNDAQTKILTKESIVESALKDAEALRLEASELRLSLEDQRRAAQSYEEKATEASQRIVRVEEEKDKDQAEKTLLLEEALKQAVILEEALSAARSDALKKGRELTLVESRVSDAESRAKAASRERDAIDTVAKAMESRATIAEATAEETAKRLQLALVKTVESESKLTAALDAVDDMAELNYIIDDDELDIAIGEDTSTGNNNTDSDADSGSSDGKPATPKKKTTEATLLASLDAPAKKAAADDLREARDTVRSQLGDDSEGLPSIWKMKKSDLITELETFGRDCTGLKVPELRAWLRVARLKQDNQQKSSKKKGSSSPKKSSAAAKSPSTKKKKKSPSSPPSDDDGDDV